MKNEQITKHLNIKELFIASGTLPSRVCKLFKFADFKNSDLQVFGILELETPRFRALRIADAVLNALQNFYKNGLETSLFDDLFFEKSIQSFNKYLVELLNQEKIIFNPLSFNVLIAASHKDNIYFSWHGNINGFLVCADLTGKRRAINLKNKFKEEALSNSPPTKILRQILSGKIQTGNFMLFTNHKLNPVLDKIASSLTNALEPRKLLPNLKGLLAETSNESQAIIIVENSAALINESGKIKAEKDSLKFGRQIFRASASLLIFTFVYATNWRGRGNEAKIALKNKINRILEPKVIKFNALPNFFKILSIISLTLVFIFLESVFIQLHSLNAQKKLESLEVEIKTLNSQLGEVQNIIIYGDFAGARAALPNLIQKIADLSPRLRRVESFNELINKTTTTWQQAWKIEKIDSLNIVDETNKNKIKDLKSDELIKITSTATDANFDTKTIWANKKSKYLYLLSKDRARLAVFNRKEDLVRQYEASSLGGIDSFAINEKTKSGYLVIDDKIYQFKLTHL